MLLLNSGSTFVRFSTLIFCYQYNVKMHEAANENWTFWDEDGGLNQ